MISFPWYRGTAAWVHTHYLPYHCEHVVKDTYRYFVFLLLSRFQLHRGQPSFLSIARPVGSFHGLLAVPVDIPVDELLTVGCAFVVDVARDVFCFLPVLCGHGTYDTAVLTAAVICSGSSRIPRFL